HSSSTEQSLDTFASESWSSDSPSSNSSSGISDSSDTNSSKESISSSDSNVFITLFFTLSAIASCSAIRRIVLAMLSLNSVLAIRARFSLMALTRVALYSFFFLIELSRIFIAFLRSCFFCL
ncbi:uncharacterized protein CYBJADRAFT_180899, partial [Cyberlindnera jadinii NRRL Y-1542]